jgi:hypothetical protein
MDFNIYIWQSLFYLTSINFLLVIFSHFTHKYINLLFTSLFVFMGGMYVSYINPGYFIQIGENNEKKEIFGLQKVIYDSVFHVIPLIYVFIMYRKYYSLNPSITSAIILIIVYLCSVDVKKVYNTDENVIGLLFISLILFYSYFNKLI